MKPLSHNARYPEQCSAVGKSMNSIQVAQGADLAVFG